MKCGGTARGGEHMSDVSTTPDGDEVVETEEETEVEETEKVTEGETPEGDQE
jgi:hypothetical protein